MKVRLQDWDEVSLALRILHMLRERPTSTVGVTRRLRTLNFLDLPLRDVLVAVTDCIAKLQAAGRVVEDKSGHCAVWKPTEDECP